MLRSLFGDPLDKRIRQIEKEILACLDKFWDLSDQDGIVEPMIHPWDASGEPGSPLEVAMTETTRSLTARWPETELGSLAADMYFNPMHWQHRYDCSNRYTSSDARYPALLYILETLLAKYPPSDIHLRLEGRLRQLLEHPFVASEIPKGQDYPPAIQYLPPKPEECLSLLVALSPSAENLGLMEKMVLGEMNFGPFKLPDERWPRRSYQIYGNFEISAYFPRMVARLFEHGRLSYEIFAQAVTYSPKLVGIDEESWAECIGSADLAEFCKVAREYCDRIVRDMAADLTEDNCVTIQLVGGLRGSYYLLQAARHHAAHKLGKLVWRSVIGEPKLDEAIVSLAMATDVEPDSGEERRRLIAQLKEFPAPTLEYLLPVAFHSRRVLCEALGWKHAWPLIEQILKIAGQTGASRYIGSDVHNSPDPSVGTLDVAAVRAALESAGEEVARRLLTLFRDANVNANNVVVLIEALAGWNRPKVEQRLGKRDQTAVKAYGLLPIERGEEEILERYLFLRNFARESKQFGPQRQASEQGAAQAGMNNLAQVAGYPNVTRLEWAMEARVSSEVPEPGTSWSVGNYRVELRLDEKGPGLDFWQQDRRLKSVPATVRKSAAYKEIRGTLEQLKDQFKRFRETLEDLMAAGESLGPEDLAAIGRLPVARILLSRLILRTADGKFGLFNAEPLGLRTLDGSVAPLKGDVCVAHPYHLFHAGELAGWQREIVRQRMAQPFKQAFRELYVLTPAEQETRTFSNRFAGHTLEPRVTAKLFQARRWNIGTDMGLFAYKRFASHGLEADWEFPDAGSYLSETEIVTSDRIYFEFCPPRAQPEADRQQPREESWVPLEDVPPVVFSEVMRDADLVASVAQKDAEALISEQTFQRRTELVQMLLEDLGVSDVGVEGHFAHVQGKLAKYRVHLGSAVIHIEPGNYLCVVPERWGKTHEKVFLPFADADDPKLSEVISKILLLVNDDKIKDKNILNQIQRTA